MKKVISIIIVFVLVFTLSGCFLEPEEPYCNEEVCYTQDEVDELLLDVEDAWINMQQRLDLLEQGTENLSNIIVAEEVIQARFESIEELIENQANVKERTYDIIEVEVVSVNGNIYLVETLNLINADQYILVSYNHIFVVGDKTHIASYYDGDVRLWNELKEFED